MITATITLNYTEEQIKKYATFAGWTPVDENDTSYVEFAKERLIFIIKKDFKAKIDTHKVIIDQSSEILRKGVKIIQKSLPCFLSADKLEKNWVDLETGEIVMTRPANQNDIQQSIFDENFVD